MCILQCLGYCPKSYVRVLTQSNTLTIAREKAAKALKEKGDTPEELLRSIKENEAAAAEAQRTVDAWKAIVGEKARREEAAKAEAERIATEKAEAERKAAEERERAEKEEKARIEAERKAEEERKTKEEERKERDENGQPFVVSSDGTTTFGEITEDTGLTAAPIKLSEGVADEKGNGYGLRHIEARHGDQIRKAGFSSVEEFIEQVAKNYDVIKEGSDRNGNKTYRLLLTDKHNNTLMIELSKDGSYWNVNTAGVFKKSYGKDKKEVYNRHTTVKQSAETAETSQADEHSGTQSTSRMNVPTTSADKGSEISEEKQGKEQGKMDVVDVDNPQSWVGHTFTGIKGLFKGQQFVCEGLDGDKAVFHLKTADDDFKFSITKMRDMFARGWLRVENADLKRGNESVFDIAAAIAKKEGKEAAERQERMDGYTADMPPMRRARVRKTLGKKLNYRNFGVMTEGEFVESMVAAGGIVTADFHNGKMRRLIDINDGELGHLKYPVSKAAADYAVYLGAKVNESELVNAKTEARMHEIRRKYADEDERGMFDNEEWLDREIGNSSRDKRKQERYEDLTEYKKLKEERDAKFNAHLRKSEKKQEKQSVFDKAKEIADKEEKKRKAEADSVLGQATRAVGKKKKVNRFKYTASKIISYPALRGVHYANGYAYASDGYILFKEKADYPKEWEGTTRDKDGNLIDGKYPDAEKAIPRLVHIPDKEAVSLPSKEVLDFAIAASKKLKGEAIPVAIDGLFFNAVNLKKFLEAVASKGMDKIVYRHPMLYATNGKDEIVMMPTVNTLEGALDIADRMESAGLPKEQIDAWKAHIEAADKKMSLEDFKKAVENAKKEGVRHTEAEKPKEQPLTEAERKDAEEVAGALGYRVEWVDTMEENGMIDAYKKVIRIAKDAENPLVQVLGHEVAHGVRRMIGGKFRTLQKAAKEVVGEKEWNERIEKKRKLNAYAEGKLAEEVTCDIVGEALNDKDALKRLAESLRGERGILARLRDAVAKMVEYFKNRGDKEGVRRMKAADKLLAEFESALKEGVAPEQVKPEDVDRSVRENRSEKTELTAEERELRDNLVERMRKGGLDVVTDSEEMQRVIDTENERTRESRKRRSAVAEERLRVGNTIDEAMAAATHLTKEEARAMRREWERKFKEETKELYGRVLSGNFDDVTLRLIDKFVDNSTPNNPYERPISKRLPARALQKMRGGERTGSIDALFSRISESAVGKDGKALPRAERERAIEEKKKELLKKWAIATGNWHTDIADFTDQREPIGSGTDSDVYLGKDGKSVIKVSKGKPYGKRFRPDVDNVALFNTVFPGSRYTIEGYGEIDGKFVRFLKQPIVDFTSSTPLTEGERVAYMEKLGFKPINKENTAFSNGEIIASDLQKSNIVKDKQGNVRVIDADMKLHTKDFGGKFSYPDAETDTRTAGVQRFLRTADGEVYGLVKDGRIYLDPKVATSETAVHEYTHLWGDMLRRKDSEQWSHTVKELKNSVLWEEVKESYPELKTDDEIADEVLSTFSGRRGAERLREEARRVAEGDGGVFTKAKAIETLERVKEAIARFWEGVARMFGINRYRSAEELADMAMRDLLDSKNPMKDESGMRKRGEVGETLATSGTYFSGGGLLEAGLKGVIDPKVAVEFSEKIAGVYADNHGNHIVVADVRDVDPKKLVGAVDGGEVQYFHASPVCKNFSKAKREGGEVELDKETALSTAEFIAKTRPKVVTIENVKGYRNSEALKIITDELTRQGYDWDADVYNAADYGGYTKRERLIVRAKRDGKLPPKPEKLPEELRKKGWYSAVEDLIPHLEEKKTGVPQGTDERLKNSGIDYRTIDKPLYVFGRGYANKTVGHAFADELLPTLTTGGGDIIIMPDGRVLKASPRVLARVTGLPDTYKMPETDQLSHTIVGNGIPTQLTEGVIAPLLDNAIPSAERATKRESVFDVADRVSQNLEERTRAMGSRVEKRMADVAQKLEGRELTAEQKAVVDVFSGEKDNQKFSVERNGVKQQFLLKQGQEDKAGAKHSLYRHYGTNTGVITADDVLKIPQVLERGERIEKAKGGKKMAVYTMDIDGVKYTVLTRVGKNNEIVDDFYSNKKGSESSVYRNVENIDNTPEGARRKDSEPSAKVEDKSESPKLFGEEIIDDGKKGSDSIDRSVRENPKNEDKPRFSRKPGESIFDYASRVSEDVDRSVREIVSARDEYEKKVKSKGFQTKEALQNSMLGLQEFMSAIDHASGNKRYIEDIPDFENPILGENRLSSVNKEEMHQVAKTQFKPLMSAVAKLSGNGKESGELYDYMFAKHGLERDAVMRQREAQKEFDKYQKANPKGTKTIGDFVASLEGKDYAGLTALTAEDGRVKSIQSQIDAIDEQMEATDNQLLLHYLGGQKKRLKVDLLNAARDAADDIRKTFENNPSHDRSDINELWSRVNEVNGNTLRKLYESGMLTKEAYNDISSMYTNYIPMRGFDQTTSADAYAYLTHGDSAFNAPIKTAKGRSSKADNPIAYMQAMAESAIMQGNRNVLVKQKMLNFVRNHPSDLASVSDVWLQYDSVADEWKPVFPDNIGANDSASVVAKKMEAFEDKMKQMAEKHPDLVQRSNEAPDIPYKVVEKGQLNEHQVLVKQNGKSYIITVNGSPRAAQAANGLTNPDTDLTGAVGKVFEGAEALNRQLSSLYTTLNPDFIGSNYVRDALYSNTMVYVKEGAKYGGSFNLNFAKYNPAEMANLYARYNKGSLDTSNETHRLFLEFMQNGGETGFVNLKQIEKRKSEIAKAIKRDGRISAAQIWGGLSDAVDFANRAVENSARFAAYVTSRKSGRSVGRSVYDAKEISVNFNRKGSGRNWWKDNVGTSRFYDTEIGLVEINRASVGSSLAHRYSQVKLDVITSLAECFNNAVYFGSMQDFSRQEGVKSHYFAYPINYNGNRNYVFCRAMQDANKSRLYVHEVFLADNIEKGNTLQTAASQPHGGITLYKDILANVLAANVTNDSETSKPCFSRKPGESIFDYASRVSEDVDRSVCVGR